MRRATVFLAGLALLLTGCGGVGSGGTAPHQQHNTDPVALRGKLEAMMADECFTSDPRKVYPACNKFFVELVGTANAVKDALPGKPASVRAASDKLGKGMHAYNANQCGPADKRIIPSKTDVCATALQTTRAGMQNVYDQLYPAPGK
ncbi:hypothetical protein [Sciscionella marina]|uniref:hypothetical protein n=1 Tax=Sciscionella marina TaxID=508770 RepID=UPI0003A2AE90|nr:hypothetical protein [Sciscionella marina]